MTYAQASNLEGGTLIYYYHANGDTYPAVFRTRGKKRVQIRYDSLGADDVIAWVSPSRIEVQATPPKIDLKKLIEASQREPHGIAREDPAYATYADARAGYSGQYISYSDQSLEDLERRLLDTVTRRRWQGTPEEEQLAHVQAELDARLKETSR